MSTGIYSIVEKKDPETGVWSRIGGFISGYYNPKSEYFNGEEYKNSETPLGAGNYTLFSMLAGVRMNERVIAVISPPRGLPDGMVNNDESDPWVGDRFHSWLTLKEIVDHLNTNPRMRNSGYVSAEMYAEYLKKGRPSCWSQDVFGKNVRKVSNEEMLSIVKGRHLNNRENYTYITWDSYVKDEISTFVTQTLPQLKERSEMEDYSDIRLVFGFD